MEDDLKKNKKIEDDLKKNMEDNLIIFLNGRRPQK